MNEIERHVSNMHVQLQQLSSRDRRRDVTALLPTTGGRPAFHTTAAKIQQLRDTGMTWKSIEEFFGISESPLSRRRIDHGILTSFSEISDEVLDGDIEKSRRWRH